MLGRAEVTQEIKQMEIDDLSIAYVTGFLNRASNFKAQTTLKHYATHSIKLS